MRDDDTDTYVQGGCGWFAKLDLSTSQGFLSQHVGTNWIIWSSDIKVYPCLQGEALSLSLSPTDTDIEERET